MHTTYRFTTRTFCTDKQQQKAHMIKHFYVNATVPYLQINKDQSLGFLTTLLNMESSSAGISGQATLVYVTTKQKQKEQKYPQKHHHYIILTSLAVFESETIFNAFFSKALKEILVLFYTTAKGCTLTTNLPISQAAASITMDTERLSLWGNARM